MITLDSVSVAYGKKVAVRNFSHFFDLGVTTIIGPNGAGKSTLLQSIAGLISVSSGAINILGCNVAAGLQRHETQQHLGYLPQQPDFPGDFTVGEMLHYSAWLNRLDMSQTHEALTVAYSRFGVSSFWDQQLEELSGGMRQRAFLCQSLLLNPEILLLDEPTSAIDAVKRGEFRSEVTALGANRTVILTTHVVEDVASMADNVVVMAEGSIAFSGNSDELFELGLHSSTNRSEHPIEAAMRVLSNRPDEALTW